MEQTDSNSQWRVKLTTTLLKTKADQIWPFFQDFFGIYKWFPNLSISYGVAGNNGEIGSTRYCNGFSITSQENRDEKEDVPISWSKERLIAIDSEQKTLSYEMVDSNIGFKNYVSTIKIVSDGEEESCLIEWSFSVDRVEGLILEDLVKKYETGFQGMIQKMEEALASNHVEMEMIHL